MAAYTLLYSKKIRNKTIPTKDIDKITTYDPNSIRVFVVKIHPDSSSEYFQEESNSYICS
ncbi:unnamed protein product [Clavelina lepadiformis]|uniref:Uncharacterized protein n=1 Tax=Clavelina lepadiformis TaxID=159417 RepID=A0ABP0GHJ8_CLALP